jgi:hypothetical protein
VLGVDVLEGKLKIGTPICVVLPPDSNVAAAKSSTTFGDTGIVLTSGPTVLSLGRVSGIEINHAAQASLYEDGATAPPFLPELSSLMPCRPRPLREVPLCASRYPPTKARQLSCSGGSSMKRTCW